MSDFQLVDPQEWTIDIHSVYTAYMGYFQIQAVPWWDRTWGHLFESFNNFLAFSWPVLAVTNTPTAKGHVVTRPNALQAFIKMVKTRFGETLPPVDRYIQYIEPFETAQRPLRTVTDYASYKKLSASLPAVVLAAQRTRVRQGDIDAIRALWNGTDRTFMAIDLEWSERNPNTVLEWGYTALRCGLLKDLNQWPPVKENYRQGHYIVAEHVDKIRNKHTPNYPWQYAFGDSQVLSKAQLSVVIQAIINSLASPESDVCPNTLVLVAHGLRGDLERLDKMGIQIPTNVLTIDTSVLERRMFDAGERGTMRDPRTNEPRAPGITLSLTSLVHTLSAIPEAVMMHNAGNDARMMLWAFQKLMDPSTPMVVPSKRMLAAPPPMVMGGSLLGLPTLMTGLAVVDTPGGWSSGSNTPSPGVRPKNSYFPAEASGGGNSPASPMRRTQSHFHTMPNSSGAGVGGSGGNEDVDEWGGHATVKKTYRPGRGGR